MCQRQCEYDAIHVADNLASVTYENCVQCGKCAEKCPAKVITPPLGPSPDGETV
jgi:Fe-S-cluster-containing hydrogenase component 2